MKIVAQDAQVSKNKNSGVRTSDKVYQKWVSESSYWNPPYINDNPDYNGGMSSHAPKQMVFGSGTPK